MKQFKLSFVFHVPHSECQRRDGKVDNERLKFKRETVKRFNSRS